MHKNKGEKMKNKDNLTSIAISKDIKKKLKDYVKLKARGWKLYAYLDKMILKHIKGE